MTEIKNLQKYQLEQIDIIFQNIYDNVFKFNSIQELLKEIQINFNTFNEFVFIWTGIYQKKLKYLNLISFSDNFKYRFDKLENELNLHISQEKILNSFFYFNNDINKEKNNFYSLVFKNELKKNQIQSYLIFGLPINEEENIIISFFTQKQGYFKDKLLEKLESFQKNLSIFLKFTDNFRNSFILYNTIEFANIWFIITDIEGNIEYVNPIVEKVSGYKKEELIGKKTNIFKSELHPVEFYKKLWDTIKNKNKPFWGIFINKNKNNELFYLNQSIIPIHTFYNEKKFISIGYEISQESFTKEMVKVEIESFDPITKLPNESIFLNYIKNQIKKSSKTYACILLDIHNFTYINSFFDKEIADEILKIFSQNLIKYFYKNNNTLIARIHADEFGIFLEIPDIEKNQIPKFLNKLFDNLDKKVTVNNLDFYLNFHCGIAIYPYNAKNVKSLYHYSQIALKKCKTENIKNLEFYSKTIEERSKLYFMIQQKSNYFDFKNEFYIEFQPYFDLKDISLYGFEILSRWKEPTYGNIPPYQFISIFEKSGLIKSFEFSLLEHFIEIYKNEIIQNPHLKNKQYSINLSPITFSDSYFMEKINEFLINSKIDLTFLTIEITESTYIENLQYAQKIIEKIKSTGIKISIDDFGTGYSSLKYLMDLDIDYIKIDKSFIQNFSDKRSFFIIETIRNLSKKLNVPIIAEGIESRKQLNFLQKIEINYGQGFLFSKPLTLTNLFNALFLG
jgi:PAS domain S-box-containing protein/diguanylate cyclase (GGDEF)-like protein